MIYDYFRFYNKLHKCMCKEKIGYKYSLKASDI